MEVDKGKALANAFICMEDVFRGHKEKADRENDDVVTLCNAAGRAKEIEKDRQAEVIRELKNHDEVHDDDVR